MHLKNDEFQALWTDTEANDSCPNDTHAFPIWAKLLLEVLLFYLIDFPVLSFECCNEYRALASVAQFWFPWASHCNWQIGGPS